MSTGLQRGHRQPVLAASSVSGDVSESPAFLRHSIVHQIRVAATSINLSDWETLRGTPLYARIGGLRRPARPILGSDIAGVVEAVGTAVTSFAPGDEVYGDNLWLKGGFAELAVAPADALAPSRPS